MIVAREIAIGEDRGFEHLVPFLEHLGIELLADEVLEVFAAKSAHRSHDVADWFSYLVFAKSFARLFDIVSENVFVFSCDVL